MVDLLKQLPGPMEIVTVEQFQHVAEVVAAETPDAIIVLVNNPVNSFIDCLKNLRVNNGNDDIPIYVFTELPEKDTLQQLMALKKA